MPFIPRHDPVGPEVGIYCDGVGGGGAQDVKAPIARVMRIGSVYFMSVSGELITWDLGLGCYCMNRIEHRRL